MTPEQYLQENELRKIEPEYNPVSGLNAYGERKQVEIAEFGTLYLPVSLVKIKWVKQIIKAGSISEYCQKDKDLSQIDNAEYGVTKNFIVERFAHDPEYWMATVCKVKIKNKPKIDNLIPTKTQRKVLYDMLDDWFEERPVRFIVVKCRQAFITTIVAAFNIWVQTCVFKNWNSLICGDVENQATSIRGVQDRIVSNIPALFTEKNAKFILTPYEGSQKSRVLSQRECIISTGSMQKPENVRSADNSSAHCTEVGLWKTTLGKSPEDLIQAIRGGMDDVAYTVFGLESSPKGTGNYFYEAWQKAKRGESDLKPIFLPWYFVLRYSKQIDDIDKFFKIFLHGENSEYLKYLWSIGATLEQINWYIHKLKTMEHWRVQSEFPSDDIEAFQSTGSRVFAMKDVDRRRKECMLPIFEGDIYGKSRKGSDALKEVKLETLNKCLKIWCYPDKDIQISDRYLVVVDIGKGKSRTADFSVITVIDRYEIMYGGKPEIVAEWVGKIDIDLLAWKAAQIALLYNNALLAIEKNTIDTITDYHKVLLSELNDEYDNLYCTVTVDKVRNITEKTIGWHTNTSTKPLIIENMQSALRDDMYYERNKDACVEMDTYELKEDGSYGAADKCHDDMVMTRAIGLYISTKMPVPKEIKKEEVKVKKVIGYASM